MGVPARATAAVAERPKDLLRFITCGSVDDGKSTLIGRLLHDTGSVADDLIAAAWADSARWGTTGDDLDLALLVDGLQSEREQGITIDVAHRYFDTPRRKFILADTPGHEQYTRNMATGASGADLAILLVDATRGVLPQTRRHAFIVRQLGIRHVVVAVNKMDRVEWSRATFDALAGAAHDTFAQLGFERLQVVPLSALTGDHVVRRSEQMAWYAGPTLLEALETAPVARLTRGELRLPIQYVHRPDASFRGYAGTIAAGRLRVGDRVVALPSGARATVRGITAPDGDRREAGAGDAVVVTLAENVDLARGQVLAHADAPPSVARRLEADVVWMADAPLAAGRQYEAKFAHRYVVANVARVVHRVDIESYEAREAETLRANDVGRCEFTLADAVALDPFDDHPTTGSFVLIDLETQATVGAGLVRSTASGRLVAADTPVTRERRATQKRQRPFVVWLTGLSGAGKSVIAAGLEQVLMQAGHHTYLLDGDRVRQSLNADLGFSELDRAENVRRVAAVARILADAGLVVVVACIAPLATHRAQARETLGEDYVEVHVHASVETCERRDPKGHYRRVRAGSLQQFTGIDARYETPAAPDLRIDTEALAVDQSVDAIVKHLMNTGRVSAGVEADWVL